MAEFLVELFAPREDGEAVDAGAGRARTAAERLDEEGRSIRYIRSIFVPEDETCFLLFEAGSIDTVRDAASRAGLGVERISETMASSIGDAR